MTDVLSGAAGWSALTSASGAALTSRDVIVCHGPDTVTFLQGQLSQDVAAMAPGEVRWSLHLQPQGKVIAVLRLTRLAGDGVLIDTDPGAGADVHAALSRFKIRTKSELVLIDGVPTLAVRGPGDVVSDAVSDAAAASAELSRVDVAELLDGTVIRLPLAPWQGPGHDVLAVGKAPGDLPTDGAVPVDAEVFEAHRIWLGVPRHGAEIVDGPIPVETGLIPSTVAFGKGCYVGQELVERLDSRGRQIRRLMVLDLAAPAVLGVGQPVTDPDGKQVGAVTSTASRPDTKAAVAIALLRADVEEGSTVQVDGHPALVRLPAGR